MSSIVILTPSYRMDLERFKRLHDSVLRFTEPGVIHHAIVPRRDLALFQRIESPRLRVWAESDYLPQGFKATDRFSATAAKFPFIPSTLRCSAINLKRPWPPVRGWVLQQLLKLSFCSDSVDEAVIIIDSDVILVRMLSAEQFFRMGVVRLYENPYAIDGAMRRHVIWTKTAHRLLGLPEPAGETHSDYVGGIISWDPEVLRKCLTRIEEVFGGSWASVIAAELHFSEFILYGTYIHHFGTDRERSFSENRTLCHSYWNYEPLDESGVLDFVGAFDVRDLAVHIQSNSGTSDLIVDQVVASLRGNY